MLIVHRVMNVTRFRSFRVGARSIECFSSLSSRQKMLFFYPRYEKRFYILRDAGNAVYPCIWAYCKKLYLSAVRCAVLCA